MQFKLAFKNTVYTLNDLSYFVKLLGVYFLLMLKNSTVTILPSLAACCTAAKNLGKVLSVLVLKRLYFLLCFNKSILYDNVATALNGSGQNVSLVHLMQPDCWSPIIWLAVPQEMIWFNRWPAASKTQQSQKDSACLPTSPGASTASRGLCPQLRTPCPCCLQQMIYVRWKQAGAEILKELWLLSDFKHKYTSHYQTKYLGLQLDKLEWNYSPLSSCPPTSPHCQDFLFDCLRW